MDERDAIRAELTWLRGRLREIAGMGLSSSAATQMGLGGGIEPRDVHRINAAIRAAHGVDRITRRIADLEAKLEESPPED